MILELPPTLVMRYRGTVRLSVILLFGLGMVIFGGLFVAVINGSSLYCFGLAVMIVLLLIPIWRFTGRSVLEVSGAGITKVDWRGKRQQWAWDDIGKVTYSHMGGQLTLWHQQSKQRLQFSNQREFFVVMPLLLTHYCPTLWRLDEPRSFRPPLPMWIQVLLVVAINVAAWLWLAVWTTPQPFTFVVLIGLTAISLALLWNVKTSLTITPTALVLAKWRRQREIPIETINDVGFSAANAQGYLHFSPTVMLENDEFIRLDGFGDGISLYCILLRQWLDVRKQTMEVVWGERVADTFAFRDESGTL